MKKTNPLAGLFAMVAAAFAGSAVPSLRSFANSQGPTRGRGRSRGKPRHKGRQAQSYALPVGYALQIPDRNHIHPRSKRP